MSSPATSRPNRRNRLALTLLLAAGAALAPPSPASAATDDPPDPLATEIARLTKLLADTPSTNPIWLDAKTATEPVLARASAALRDGSRLLALQRLGVASVDIAASGFVIARPEAELTDEAAFESTWTAARAELDGAFATPTLDDVRPAAVRGFAEDALHRVPILYLTSLDYGRATSPDVGLYYIGEARAQADFAAFCRGLPAEGAARPAPPLRDIGAEIDALEAEVLAAYRPPASIERHREFILVGSLIKEAREMNGQGLRCGALLEYLHGVMRFAPLRAGAAPLEPDALAARLTEAGAQFAADAHDQSLGTLFVETGLSDLQAAAPGTPPLLARAIVADVLPRYAAALAPARPVPECPRPELDLTLVRWPFT